MIFIATKVIYDTYSGTISGMSREMVEMDGRNSTECQNWENRDKIGIMEIVKVTKRQNREHDPSSPIKTKPKKRGEQIFISSSHF